MQLFQQVHFKKRLAYRKVKTILIKSTFLLATLFSIAILILLIIRIFMEGISSVNLNFLMYKLSTNPTMAGIMGAILGTLWLMLIIIPITGFIGIGTAIYLEFYIKEGPIKSLIQTNISNLSGVPSIVYGILGMTIFVRAMELGNVILAGGLTMSLLILPIIIVASQEALKAVPNHLYDASIAVGATKGQTIQQVILPVALPSILTGAILAYSRAIGETAPLTVIGIPALLIPFPNSLFDRFTTLPMQIYYWTLDAALVEEYANLAAATIIVLLCILFSLNIIAILLRNKFQINI